MFSPSSVHPLVIHFSARYSVTLSKSALKISTPAQRKRLLSIVAADSNTTATNYETDKAMRMDSPTGQALSAESGTCTM